MPSGKVRRKWARSCFTQLWHDCQEYQCHSSGGLLQCVTPALMQEEKPGGKGYLVSWDAFSLCYSILCTLQSCSTLRSVVRGPRLLPRSLFLNTEQKIWGKSCNNLQPFLSLTGLPHKGLARLHPRALWGVSVCRAGAAAPPGMVSQCCSHCRASCLRHFLSEAAVSPGCTRSPRPSWKVREDIHHQPEIFLTGFFLPLTLSKSWLKLHYIFKDYFFHRKWRISYYCLEF